MCPFCIGTAIWIAAGAVAAGGATAVTAAKFWNKKAQQEQGGEHDEQ